jgi:hypothetical protein
VLLCKIDGAAIQVYTLIFREGSGVAYTLRAARARKLQPLS